jgi:thiosulfate/3-mercaptopyruvate sulfurtransferase
MKNFIDCDWLHKHLNDSSVAIIDCRFDLFDPSYGKNAYEEHHIEGAYFLDINTDLSGEKARHGGARPLPDTKRLIQKLESMGIKETSTIVCYDDETCSSGRAWWQLKRLGFKNIYILNGGYRLWQKNQLPMSCELPNASATHKLQLEEEAPIYCTMEYVKEAINDPNAILIDSREERRYTGEYEPLYAQKGHIPKAINIPYQRNIASNGQLEPLHIIQENFKHLDKSREIITYCGSGINGAINFAILDELGYDVKLYVGSVSDWITYEENILELG